MFYFLSPTCGNVAQLAEQVTLNHLVAGSIPVIPFDPGVAQFGSASVWGTFMLQVQVLSLGFLRVVGRAVMQSAFNRY